MLHVTEKPNLCRRYSSVYLITRWFHIITTDSTHVFNIYKDPSSYKLSHGGITGFSMHGHGPYDLLVHMNKGSLHHHCWILPSIFTWTSLPVQHQVIQPSGWDLYQLQESIDYWLCDLPPKGVPASLFIRVNKIIWSVKPKSVLLCHIRDVEGRAPIPLMI